MTTRIHTFLLRGSKDTGDALGFQVQEAGTAVLLHPDSQYAEQEVKMTHPEVEALHGFLGEMLDVMES